MSSQTKSAGLTRRDWLTLSAAGVVGYSMSGWLGNLAAQAAENPNRRRSCILLWMSGGPSQMDTFDLKPGQANGGPYRPIATAVPGIQISEHLPHVARMTGDMAIIRSMASREADHGRATYQMRTGLRADRSRAISDARLAVFARAGTPRRGAAEFREHRPLSVLQPRGVRPRLSRPAVRADGAGGRPAIAVAIPGAQPVNYEDSLRVPDLDLPTGVTGQRSTARVDLLDAMERDFIDSRPGLPSQSHRGAYQRAVTLMRSAAHAGLRPSTRSRRACATATAVLCSDRAACWRDDWSSAACPSSKCRSPTSATCRSAGIRTSTTSTACAACAKCSIPPGPR